MMMAMMLMMMVIFFPPRLGLELLVKTVKVGGVHHRIIPYCVARSYYFRGDDTFHLQG